MCGIFGYIGKNENAASIVLEGLKRLEYRGYDSWGVAAIPVNMAQPLIVVKKNVGKIGQATVKDMPKSSFAFGHTRWATHGGVTMANAHPHLDCQEKTAVIHNGIIENYLELKDSLKPGHIFRSETDTEVAIHLIEEKLKTEPILKKAVLEVFKELKGNNAIIVANRETRQLIAAKNGSPLILGFGEDATYLASDPSALLPHTKTVYFLEDGQMAVLVDNKAELYDINTGKMISFEKMTLNWSVQQADKGKYAHFMEKEMREQPSIVNDIALQTESEAKKIVKLLRKYNDIFFIGCGTASYAGWAATYLFSNVANKKVNWAPASEFNHWMKFINEKTLIFALSQSGETMDLLTIIKQAKKQGAKVISLINVLGSTLYRISDEQILIGAGPEKAVACTKAFIGKIAHLVRLAYVFDGRYKEGQNLLVEASKASQEILTAVSWQNLEELAEKLIDNEHIFVIGRGISSVAATEIALKIKEISYIHAEGLVGGELKHGPLALIENGTPCIVIAPEDESYNATMSSAMEIKARGGFIVGIATKNNPVFDIFVSLPYVKEATLIPAVIVGQVLSYHMTILKKLDPDKPRNLAKSVTVG